MQSSLVGENQNADQGEESVLCPGECEEEKKEEYKANEMKKLEILKLAQTLGGFMNPHTGTGAVITNCKHHAHVSCLQEYCQQ